MISVCIPTYNGAKFIKKQLASILHQLDTTDEIIISDDGSTDSTIDIINEFSDERLKVFYHNDSCISKYKFNLTTRNISNAISKASGDIIFLADQDDIWNNDKVKLCKQYLQNYDLILHDCEIVDQNNELLNSSYFELNNSKPGIVKNIMKNSYLGCCMVMKRQVINLAMPFPNSEVPHDIWIGLIAEKFGKVIFAPEKLVRYRRHGNNLSASGEASTNSIIFKILYRLIILKEFFKKISNIK